MILIPLSVINACSAVDMPDVVSDLVVYPTFRSTLINRNPDVPSGQLPKYKIRLNVLLLNNGTKTLRIPTGGASVSTEDRLLDDGKRQFSLRWSVFLQSFANIETFPSEASLSIVELHPGDATLMEVETDVSAAYEPSSIIFRLQIDPKIGRRFGTWFGVIRSNLLPESVALDVIKSKRLIGRRETGSER
jgi:hypothetical protein